VKSPAIFRAQAINELRINLLGRGRKTASFYQKNAHPPQSLLPHLPRRPRQVAEAAAGLSRHLKTGCATGKSRGVKIRVSVYGLAPQQGSQTVRGWLGRFDATNHFRQ